MSFYSVPDDMTSGKSWNEMVAANMKAFGMPDMALPEFKTPDFNMPDFKLPDMPQVPVEMASMAAMPLGIAASMMGAWAGALASAMDATLAASRQMTSLALPEDAVSGAAATEGGEIVSFAPKEAARKRAAAARPKAETAPALAEAAPALAEATPVDEAAVAAPEHSVSEAAPALVEPVVTAPVLAEPVNEAASAAEIVITAPAPAVEVEVTLMPLEQDMPATAPAPASPSPKAARGLLDLVAVDEAAAPAVAPAVAVETVMAVHAEAPVLAPEDFKRPAAMAKPEALDDLKLISGVGPKIEGILHGLGIYTFAQVASWAASEVAWVDDYLNFKGRITRDNWIAQADALAAGGRDEYVKRFGKEPR
jgi:NADH-quinone oxidoreductase subunit E